MSPNNSAYDVWNPTITSTTYYGGILKYLIWNVAGGWLNNKITVYTNFKFNCYFSKRS